MTLDELRKAIEATADEAGSVTDAGVVEAARDPAHPLHADPGFCWDNDDEAAQRWRLTYAGKLRRKVFFIVRPVERRRMRVPYFVRSPRLDENEPGHVPLQSVEPASAGAGIVLQDELRRVVGILRRSMAVAKTLESDLADELMRLHAAAAELQARLLQPVPMPSAARTT